jgi:hypothetical protein
MWQKVIPAKPGRPPGKYPQTSLRIAATPEEKAKIEKFLSTRRRVEVLLGYINKLGKEKNDEMP